MTLGTVPPRAAHSSILGRKVRTTAAAQPPYRKTLASRKEAVQEHEAILAALKGRGMLHAETAPYAPPSVRRSKAG